MTISLSPVAPRVVAVTVRPSLIARLLGSREQNYVVQSIAEVGGRRAWINAETNRHVLDRRVLEALGTP